MRNQLIKSPKLLVVPKFSYLVVKKSSNDYVAIFIKTALNLNDLGYYSTLGHYSTDTEHYSTDSGHNSTDLRLYPLI